MEPSIVDSAQSTIGLEQAVMQWDQFTSSCFRAEWAYDSGDIVYHFYPPEEHGRFNDVQRFTKRVENAFKRIFPSNAQITAEFISKDAADIIASMGDIEQKPCDTFFVKAVGWGDRPGINSYAGHRLMKYLVEELAIVG
mgnify:FL=1